MVQKIFRFLNRESSSLHQAAYLLGLFAILSQLLAFLRDRLLAHLFGASTTLDIYYAAFRIPDFLFVTIASVVSISVLVPFIIERNSAGKVAVKEFIDSVFAFFSILIIIVSVLVYFLIPHIAPMLFRGFSAEVLEEV
ncbi:MAG: lipid II flippase MurJ, partial [bacterium]|nr:lipid II flippase MurJ [bacterium]